MRDNMRLRIHSPRHLFQVKEAREHPFAALRIAAPKFFGSLRRWNEVCLASKVIRKEDGRCFWVSNGSSHPIWDLIDVDTKERCHEHEDDLRVSITPANLWHNATYMYRWWLHNWADIEIRKRVRT